MFWWMLFIIVVVNISVFILLRMDINRSDGKSLTTIDFMFAKANIFLYSIMMIGINIGIAIYIQNVYSDHTFIFTLKRLLLLGILWPIAYIDFKTYRIPNIFIAAGLVMRAIILVFELIYMREGLLAVVLSEFVASSGLVIAAFLCTILIKNSVGYGDIKLFLVMGLFLGLDGIWGAIFVSLIVSFIVSVVLLATKKKTRKDAIPFGPAIVIGTYLSVFLTGM